MSAFRDLRPGDRVTRLLCGSIPLPLTVTAVTGDRIACGAWEFDRDTGAEIDEELGWDGKTATGSHLVIPPPATPVLRLLVTSGPPAIAGPPSPEAAADARVREARLRFAALVTGGR